MNSKLLRIFVVALTTLFLNAQAFACGGGQGAQNDKDRAKTHLDKSSMSSSDQSFSTDRNMEMDQSSYDNNKSMDRSDQSETDQFDTEQQDQLDR
jgi:hypothetical protein